MSATERLSESEQWDPEAIDNLGANLRATLEEATSLRARVRELETALALLERAAEWVRDNPPSDGWGLLDHQRDVERDDLLFAIREFITKQQSKEPNT